MSSRQMQDLDLGQWEFQILNCSNYEKTTVDQNNNLIDGIQTEEDTLNRRESESKHTENMMETVPRSDEGGLPPSCFAN
jgi:hypothetical protein